MSEDSRAAAVAVATLTMNTMPQALEPIAALHSVCVFLCAYNNDLLQFRDYSLRIPFSLTFIFILLMLLLLSGPIRTMVSNAKPGCRRVRPRTVSKHVLYDVSY